MNINFPGDAKLYRGSLKLTGRQKLAAAIYALAGIASGILLIGWGFRSGTIPGVFFGLLGMLPLWIGVGIFKNSVLRRN